MGLRCSLLGHDYGEPFVERDREERGNEVVVTERELEECTRCGAEKVTTENTEVRSLQPGSSGASDSSRPASDAATADQASESSPGPADEPASPGATDQSPGATDQTPSGESTPGAGASGSDSGGSAFTSPADAIEHAESDATDDAVAGDVDGDDAVILDDEGSADEPGSDQWDEPAEPDDDPEPEPVEDDAKVVDASAGAGQASAPKRDDQPAESGPADQQGGQPTRSDQDAASPADRSRGEWPDPEGDDEGFDATGDADDADDAAGARSAGSTFQFGDGEDVVEADTGFTSAGPLDNSERADPDELDFALYCPECGFEQYAAGSSLRAGDICPECQRGYLAEEQ